jgi:hypothetical protein
LLHFSLAEKLVVRYGAIMEAMRDNWTDARLDDLNHRVDEGFKRLESDLRALRLETKTELGSLKTEAGTKAEIGSVRSEIGSLRSEMNQRFDSLHRLIVQGGGGIIATLVTYALTSHL